MKKSILLLGLLSICFASPSYALMHAFSGLTGAAVSGNPQLNGIPTSAISNGEIAIGIDSSGYFRVYQFDSTNVAAEDNDAILIPDWTDHIAGTANSATGAWILKDIKLVDGIFTGTVIKRKPYLDTTTGTVTLAAATHSDGIYTNSGASANVTYAIEAPAAALVGTTYTFLCTDTTYNFYVDPAAGQFRGLYTTNAAGDKLSSDQVQGSILNVVCALDDDGSYYWFTSGMGTWTDAD